MDWVDRFFAAIIGLCVLILVGMLVGLPFLIIADSHAYDRFARHCASLGGHVKTVQHKSSTDYCITADRGVVDVR